MAISGEKAKTTGILYIHSQKFDHIGDCAERCCPDGKCPDAGKYHRCDDCTLATHLKEKYTH